MHAETAEARWVCCNCTAINSLKSIECRACHKCRWAQLGLSAEQARELQQRLLGAHVEGECAVGAPAGGDDAQ